jgi:hypothetical protein
MAAILAVFGDDSMGQLVPTSTLPRPVAEATQNRTRLESRAERLLSMTASKYRASINASQRVGQPRPATGVALVQQVPRLVLRAVRW